MVYTWWVQECVLYNAYGNPLMLQICLYKGPEYYVDGNGRSLRGRYTYAVSISDNPRLKI